jgi:hypothetical protein
MLACAASRSALFLSDGSRARHCLADRPDFSADGAVVADRRSARCSRSSSPSISMAAWVRIPFNPAMMAFALMHRFVSGC